MKILLCWIGNTDLVCAERNEPENLGPIAQAIQQGSYARAVFLDNYCNDRSVIFASWIKSHTSMPIDIHSICLTSPTNHKEIYAAARSIVHDVHTQNPDAKLTFHISPGTPAMALTWMLLAPMYGAQLIESSREHGVQVVQFPFEIAAYFLPDKDLTRLTENLAPTHSAFSDILFQSEIMRKTILQAQHVASRDITVLVEGESGTGKELFARAIHNSSSRAGKPFIAINCGAIPHELIESTLFGYMKGAFTGAIKDTKGVFQDANNGTLFLDELGELPLKAQVALLRTLQEKTVTRVGNSKTESVDVRIIAATNRNLLEEVAKGRFRSDLFYRLAVACISLPPLRNRTEDIQILLENATEKANKELSIHGNEIHKKFSDSAKKIMLQHSWPGNVRELYNTVMRAILWTSGDIVDADSAKQALFHLPSNKTSVLEHTLGNGFSLKDVLGDIAAVYISRANEEAGGTKAKAAKLLGFDNYQTFNNWQKKYIREDT